MSEREREHDEGGTALAPERPRVEPPQKFSVILHNDDYTPMDFVVEMLMHVFGMAGAQAQEIMMAVHQRGKAVVGAYTRDIAETKVAQAHQIARGAEHPFRCDIVQT